MKKNAERKGIAVSLAYVTSDPMPRPKLRDELGSSMGVLHRSSSRYCCLALLCHVLRQSMDRTQPQND